MIHVVLIQDICLISKLSTIQDLAAVVKKFSVLPVWLYARILVSDFTVFETYKRGPIDQTTS